MKIEKIMNLKFFGFLVLILSSFLLFNFQTSKSEASAVATLFMDQDIQIQIDGETLNGPLTEKMIRFVKKNDPNFFYTKKFGDNDIRVTDGTYDIYDLTALGSDSLVDASAHKNLDPVGQIIVANGRLTSTPVVLDYSNLVTSLYMDQDIQIQIDGETVKDSLNEKAIRFVDINNSNNFFTKHTNNNEVKLFDGTYKVYDVTGKSYDASAHKNLDSIGQIIVANGRLTSTPAVLNFREKNDVSDMKKVKSYIHSTEVPSTFLFTGGNMTFSPEGSKGYRNYIQHFEERIRWEVIKSYTQRHNFVFNTQKKGMTASQLLLEFNERVTQFQPKTVFVNLGYDDATQNTKISFFKMNLKAIINEIREIGAVPVFESPIYPIDHALADKIKIYVDAMKEVALEDEVLFINHFANWTEYNNSKLIVASDGVTPNELGHLLLSKELMSFFDIGGNGRTWGINGFKDTQGTYNFTAKLESNSNITTPNDELTKLIQGDKPITWLFTGDSITHGALFTKGYQSFAELFGERVKVGLSEIYPARENDVVLNTGVSGLTSRDLIENFDRWVTLNNPDVVFITFGMNDSAKYLVPLEEYRKNINLAIDKVRELGAIPILQTQNTVKDAAVERINTLPLYVNAVREIAEEKDVLLVDHYKYWTDAEKTDSNLRLKWLGDTVHPNYIGTAQMADTIFKTLGLN